MLVSYLIYKLDGSIRVLCCVGWWGLIWCGRHLGDTAKDGVQLLRHLLLAEHTIQLSLQLFCFLFFFVLSFFFLPDCDLIYNNTHLALSCLLLLLLLLTVVHLDWTSHIYPSDLFLSYEIMRISIVLSALLAAEAAVASSWFSKAGKSMSCSIKYAKESKHHISSRDHIMFKVMSGQPENITGWTVHDKIHHYTI